MRGGGVAKNFYFSFQILFDRYVSGGYRVRGVNGEGIF